MLNNIDGKATADRILYEYGLLKKLDIYFALQIKTDFFESEVSL